MMWIHLAGVCGAPTRLSRKFRGPGNFWSQPCKFSCGGKGRRYCITQANVQLQTVVGALRPEQSETLVAR